MHVRHSNQWLIPQWLKREDDCRCLFYCKYIEKNPNGHIIATNNLEFDTLTNIDLSGMTQVTSIGDCFLSNCESLTNIDLSGMIQVTSIGYWFLYNWRRYKYVVC